MEKKRPVNLDLRTIKLPLTAVASILHRLSGFVIFFLIPLLLWVLQLSLSSAASFATISERLQHPIFKCIIWMFIVALIYHLLAGIRHLFLDLGVADTVSSGRRAVIVVFVLTIIIIILAGWWLW